ncbi:MAG: hypothetical protein KBT32_03295, partial [Bacteroidales bacterium]|nr:hypothetical protein [Candidatus Physcocola equi]
LSTPPLNLALTLHRQREQTTTTNPEDDKQKRNKTKFINNLKIKDYGFHRSNSSRISIRSSNQHFCQRLNIKRTTKQ